MRLYKYAPPARIDVLRHGLIRFSTIAALNDPFELKPHIAALATPEYMRNSLEQGLEAAVAEQLARLPPQQRALVPKQQFRSMLKVQLRAAYSNGGMVETVMRTMLPELRKKFEEGFERTIGILCLTEDPTSLLMWAHYAASHQGFVVELDGSHPFFDQRRSANDEFLHLRKVVYADARPSLTLSEVADFIPFVTKGRDWSYEKEWRMMAPLSECQHTDGSGSDAIHLFAIPKSAITGVLLGCRASEPLRAEVRSILNSSSDYSHVSLRQATIDERHYKVTFAQ